MKLQSIWLHCKQLDYLRRFDMKRQFLKIERLNVPNKSLENWVSRLLWKTMEHFMLNEINKWQQNGITTELDNNTFGQQCPCQLYFRNKRRNWMSLHVPIFSALLLISYDSKLMSHIIKFLTWRCWRSKFQLVLGILNFSAIDISCQLK